MPTPDSNSQYPTSIDISKFQANPSKNHRLDFNPGGVCPLSLIEATRLEMPTMANTFNDTNNVIHLLVDFDTWAIMPKVFYDSLMSNMYVK